MSLYLLGANGYDLLSDDEIRYAEAGRQMLETGDWIIPQYNGSPRYQKPVFCYWLLAIVQWAFGPVSWAARIPSALAGTAVVLLTTQLGRVLWGQRAGLWSGVALALCVEVVLVSRMVLTDMVLLLCLQGGITCFCLAQLADRRSRGRWYLTMYLSLAFGLLTKGPIAVVLPLLVAAPWLLARGELIQFLREARLGIGLILLASISGPWYVLAHWTTGGEFTWHFLFNENVGRFAASVNQHQPPFLFYMLLLIPMTFPWAAILPQALWSAVRYASWRGPFAASSPWFFLWNVAVVLTLFTFSGTRVWTYTLPMFPALALLVGRWLAGHWERETAGSASPLRFAAWAFAVIALGLAMAPWVMPLSMLPEAVRTMDVLDHGRLVLGVFACLALATLAINYLASFRASLFFLSAGVACWYVLVILTIPPLFDRLLIAPVREAAASIRAHPEAMVVTYMVHELGLNGHACRGRVEHWREGSLEDLEMLLGGETPVFVLVRPEYRRDVEGLTFYVWREHPRFLFGANLPPDRKVN